MPDQYSQPAAPQDAPSREDRVKQLIAGYEHGLANNAPRTDAELKELKDLLGTS